MRQIWVWALCGALLLPSAASADESATVAELVNRDEGRASAALTRLSADLSAKKGRGLAKRKREAQASILSALALGVHPRVAAAALKALVPVAPIAAFTTAKAYLAHRNANVRAASVALLASIRDSRARSLIVAALGDSDKVVRAAAAGEIAKRRIQSGRDRLLKLLERGDESAAPALAALADAELARRIAELVGKVSDELLARCLGAVLLRPDFRPDAARVEVVRVLARLSGSESLEALTTYLAQTPENPPRLSRKEAEAAIEKKTGGEP